MKTLPKYFVMLLSLFVSYIFLFSCDGLIEQEPLESISDVELFTGEDFKLEIVVYNCNESNYSLIVTKDTEGPIEYYRQEIFSISWIAEDRIELSNSIWLECIDA